ncbi:hypothetical protein L0152_01015, partial [bacterium]|nr:hypothetical protein [bacterium]
AKGIQWEDCDPETGEREAVIDIQVSERYFRALAKIGFEYMLYFEPHGITGYEPAFDPIKNYIRHGVGKFDAFLKKHEKGIIPYVGPEYNTELTHYGHVLAFEVNSQRAIARVELFTGKSAGVGQWVISLGKCPYSLYIPSLSIGHWFKIDSGIGDANDSGEVVELTAANLIKPVSAPPIHIPRVIPLQLR